MIKAITSITIIMVISITIKVILLAGVTIATPSAITSSKIIIITITNNVTLGTTRTMGFRTLKIKISKDHNISQTIITITTDQISLVTYVKDLILPPTVLKKVKRIRKNRHKIRGKANKELVIV